MLRLVLASQELRGDQAMWTNTGCFLLLAVKTQAQSLCIVCRLKHLVELVLSSQHHLYATSNVKLIDTQK